MPPNLVSILSPQPSNLVSFFFFVVSSYHVRSHCIFRPSSFITVSIDIRISLSLAFRSHSTLIHLTTIWLNAKLSVHLLYFFSRPFVVASHWDLKLCLGKLYLPTPPPFLFPYIPPVTRTRLAFIEVELQTLVSGLFSRYALFSPMRNGMEGGEWIHRSSSTFRFSVLVLYF